VSESWSFAYFEHAKIERENHALVVIDVNGETRVPVSSLCVLMLGPGTSITHAAMMSIADNGCSVVWTGEKGVRFYASGTGETRRSTNLLAQVKAWADPGRRLDVVRRMYERRFGESLGATSIEQARGREGVRVREAYAKVGRETGVAWKGRKLNGAWEHADPVNRALSAANACLYGVCHSVIVATGFSPSLGFLHTGKSLAFVYDIADLYKIEMVLPLAFRVVAENRSASNLDSLVRCASRDRFYASGLLDRIIPDIQHLIGDRMLDERASEARVLLWGPEGEVPGAQNFATSVEEESDDP
jgi:CRISPR-associated protein Cas1